MEHGLNLAVVVAIASGLVLWSVVAERLERWNVTAPIVFVADGHARAVVRRERYEDLMGRDV